MTTIKAKPEDDLNEIFNTQCPDALCVILPKGVEYHQKVKINKDNITVIGAEGTCIAWNDHNGMQPGFGTADSATVSVYSSNVTFCNLRIENTFDYRYYKDSTDNASGMGLQAVALYIAPESDNFLCINSSFYGWQDTLFADGISTNFVGCEIEGCVDFIFGSANAVFNSCSIVSNREGFVAAPSTKEERKNGFVFVNCDFSCKPDVKEGSVFLARPWHPGGRPGVCSCMSVISCSIGNHINKELWTWMKDSKGIIHTPQESRYDIQNCKY